MVKPEDFSYLHRGKKIGDLNDITLISPVNWRKTPSSSQKNSRALLMLHGFGSTPAVYRLLFPLIKKHYDAICIPALAGHAQNFRAFEQATAADWIQGSEKACESLILEFKQVDIFGLSLGGILAYHLSQRFNIHHLCLFAPAFVLKKSITPTLALLNLLNVLGIKKIANNGGNICNESVSDIAYNQLPIRVLIELLQFIKQYPLKPPTCSMDLFLGQHDEVIHSEAVATRLTACSATYPMAIHWLENSAHLLPLDNDLNYIVECIVKSIDD